LVGKIVGGFSAAVVFMATGSPGAAAMAYNTAESFITPAANNNWGIAIQNGLNSLAMGSGNPFFMATGFTGMLSYRAGEQGYNDLSRTLGYVSQGFAAVGTGIEIKNSWDVWNTRQNVIRGYEKELAAYRAEAIKNGVEDTVDLYSRELPWTGNVAKHDALVSEIFENGRWEMGPDINGIIETTNTVKNPTRWGTHKATSAAIKNGLKPLTVKVNNEFMVKSARLFNDTFVGQQRYAWFSNNSNYAVNSVLYGAGANISSPLGYGGFRAPGFPTISPYMYKNR